MTDTAIKRQQEMDMAANLNNPEQPREELKESSDEVEVKTNRRRKNISLGIGIFLIIAIIVTVSVLLAIYLTKK